MSIPRAGRLTPGRSTLSWRFVPRQDRPHLAVMVHGSPLSPLASPCYCSWCYCSWHEGSTSKTQNDRKCPLFPNHWIPSGCGSEISIREFCGVFFTDRIIVFANGVMAKLRFICTSLFPVSRTPVFGRWIVANVKLECFMHYDFSIVFFYVCS